MDKITIKSYRFIVWFSSILFLGIAFYLKYNNYHLRLYLEYYIYILFIFSLILKLSLSKNSYCPKWLFPLSIYFIYGIIVNLSSPMSIVDPFHKWTYSLIALPILFIIFNTTEIEEYFSNEKVLFILMLVSMFISIKFVFTAPDGTFPSARGMLASRFVSDQLEVLGYKGFGPVVPATLGGIAMVSSYIMFLFTKKKMLLYSCFVAFLLSTATTIISGGRFAIFSAAITIAMISILVKINRKNSNKIIYIAIFLTILIIYFTQLNFIDLDMEDNPIARISSIPMEIINFGNTQYNYSGAQRIERWKDAIKGIINEPYGVGFYKYYYNNNATPHNEYLHQGLNTGIIGLLSYIIFLYMCLAKFLRYIIDINNRSLEMKNAIIVINCFGVFIFMLLCGIFETFYSNLMTLTLFWIYLSLGISSINKINNQKII